jgi:GWxTD domain-containing protein
MNVRNAAGAVSFGKAVPKSPLRIVLSIPIKLFVFSSVALFFASCTMTESPALDPESRDFYDTARLVMTPEEKDIFRHLPDQAARKEFIADFWAKRDPDPTTETNEFKQEFEDRIEYANKHFNEGRHGIDTDRGRIYMYLGPPERTESFPFTDNPVARDILWWIYYKYELGIEFVDPNGSGTYTINEIDGDLLGAIEMAKLGTYAPSHGGSTGYVNFELDYDTTKKEFVLAIPVKKLSFKESEGKLSASFDFEFFIYAERGTAKEKFTESRTLSESPEDLEKKKFISFTFPYDLKRGQNYVDVVLIGKDGLGKFRKIFPFRI